MRFQHLLLLLPALALVGAEKRCYDLTNLIQDEANVSYISPQVCEPRVSTVFHFWTRPIRLFVDKWIGRRHLNAPEVRKLAEDPWTIVNIPTYANYTSPHPEGPLKGGWMAHVHGNLYKRRKLNEKEVDDLISRLLIRASIKKEKFMYKMWFNKLNPEEASRARLQVRDLATAAIANGAIQAEICNITRVLNTLTSEEGAFEQWLSIPKACILDSDRPFIPGLVSPAEVPSSSLSLKPLNVIGDSQGEGKETQDAFFVPPRGLTIASDVDDILRVAEVWNWKQAILNLYTRPYQPWLGIAEVYQNWSRDIPSGSGGNWKNGKWIESDGGSNLTTNVHFHYASDSPEVNAGFYIDGTKKYFPAGSFDFRPINYTKAEDVLETRMVNLRRLLESFPERKFVLVSDTTSRSSMKGFPKLALDFPNQVQCILMRDVEATEPDDYIVPTMRHFLKVPKNKYLFFRTPSGSRTPTLANISTSHLASLAALDTSRNETGRFAPYVDRLNQGCFPLHDQIAQSTKVTFSVGTRFKSTLKLAYFKLRCMLVPRWRRPNYFCPFDRRPGTKYYDGKIEPKHDS